MSLQAPPNKWGKSYEIRFSVDTKYAPLIKRGVNLELQTRKIDYAQLRSEGATNIDLWIDGKCYPRDPRTNLPPPFSSLKELLVWVCEGQSGFYGYVCQLAMGAANPGDVLALERERDHLLQESIALNVQNYELTEKINTLQLNEERLQQMQVEVEHLTKTCEHLHTTHAAALKKNEKELRALRAKYEKQVKEGHVRKRKDLSELSQSGGHAKRLRRQVRLLMQSKTTRRVQLGNAKTGSRQHVCGDADAQQQNAEVLAKILTKGEKESLVRQPSMTNTVVQATNNILCQVGDHVQASNVLAACDQTNVSTRGFAAIRKTLKQGFKMVNPKLKLTAVPNSHQVSLLRTKYNANLVNFIGDVKSLDLELPDEPKARTTKTSAGAKPKKIILNEANSLFADLEVIQQNMVRFYNITKEEIGDSPLIFVMKLDEAEIVQKQKLERVSITLMNRALDNTCTSDDPRYFLVQSDNNIWPVACFEVAKESHHQLKYIFLQTSFPTVIQAQQSGKLLQVPEMGDYTVEWHLTANRKTIKCMYGFQHGANAKHSCIYCPQERSSKEALASDAAAIKERQLPAWKGGLFSTHFPAEPSRGTLSDATFDPILPIPLSRVHICTLHANVRMVEKILHLHFQYVWNMENAALQARSIELMEASLSAAGVHGRHIQIFEDATLSRTTGSVPNRPSMNGAHVARLFRKSTYSDEEKVWMDVCTADHHNGAEGKLSRMRMWRAYEDLQPYLTGMTLKDEERSTFAEKIQKWGKLYIDAFGEKHVTHYMHVLVRHAPWFVDKYGSLAVWSCQGMERSHASAKSAYHRHTQHGGTKLRISPIVQTFQHWYRNIQHRQNKTKQDRDLVVDDAMQTLDRIVNRS